MPLLSTGCYDHSHHKMDASVHPLPNKAMRSVYAILPKKFHRREIIIITEKNLVQKALSRYLLNIRYTVFSLYFL